jgi:hypothetical protein
MIYFDLTKIYDDDQTWVYGRYTFYVGSENFAINSRCFSLDSSNSYSELLKQFFNTLDMLSERIQDLHNIKEIKSVAQLIIEVQL